MLKDAIWNEEQNSKLYQNLIQAIEKSEEDFKNGNFREAREVFKELREKYN